jgi:CHAT domain-containing protein/tetratricopeptide (TPR) repeat protein
MNNSAASTARQLLHARSTSEMVAVLVNAPFIDTRLFIEICRHPELQGFSVSESEWLRPKVDYLSLVLRAIAEELSPDIPSEVYGMVGMAFRLQGDFDRARRSYKLSFHNAEGPSEQASALCSLGILLFQEQKLKEAGGILARARKLAEQNNVGGPTLSNILSNLGLIAGENGDLDQALSLFGEAARLAYRERLAQPFRVAQLNLASFALKAGQFARGIAALDSIRPMVENLGGPDTDAYYSLRRDLEAGSHQEGAVFPEGLAALLAQASADPTLLPELHRRLLEAPGSFEAITEALLARDGPLQGLQPDGKYRVTQVFREAAKEQGSPGALAQVTLELCRFDKTSPDDSITWLQEALQQYTSAGMPSSASTDVVRAEMHDALGDAYFHHAGSRRADDLKAATYHWGETLRFLASGRVGDIEISEIMKDDQVANAIALTHFKIGTALNALLVAQDADPQEAVAHFQAALEGLADRPANAELRAAIAVNLGNALGYLAERNISFAATGQRDRAALLRSLDLQSSILGTLGADPEGRVQTLLSMIQTYRELCDLGPDAAREYWDAAGQCLEAARSTLAQMPDPPPDQEAGLPVIEANLAIDRNLPGPQLHAIRENLRRALRLAPRVSHPKIAAGLFTSQARVEERLGNRARCYRRLLSGIASLYADFDAGAGQAAARSAVLTGLHGELTRRILSWNDSRRALFFINAQLSRNWNTAGGVRRYLPRAGNWTCQKGQAAIGFYAHLEEAVAFVVTQHAVRFYRYDFNPRKLLELGARWLTASMDARSAAKDESGEKKWEAAIDGVSNYMGQMLFDPLTSMLPERCEMTIVPDYSMRIMPLHLARMSAGAAPSRLMEQYAIRRCEYLDFWGEGVGAAAAVGRESVFVAAYSPPDARLPFAALEVAAIAAARPGQAEVAPVATPEAVLDGIETHRVVHLCCHGSWAWNDPLESTLTLAGRSLTLREIVFRLERSPCELIVLSACDVGTRGSDREGPEGFASVLLHAGCRAFLGAEWRVDDLATALLMSNFYEQWKGSSDSAAAALCKAQAWLAGQTGELLAARARALREQSRSASDVDGEYIDSRINGLALNGGSRPFAHPMYWGAFCLTERTSPLVRRPKDRD